MGRRLRSREAISGIAAAAVLAGAVLVGAPAATAATCAPVPGSTPGTNVTIAGQVHRVPAISNIRLCVGDGAVPLVSVETYGGGCTAACLAVVVRGSGAGTPGVTLAYYADGVPTDYTVDSRQIGGPGTDTCLLGVGAPVAPRSGCLFAVEPDGAPIDDGLVDQVVALVLAALQDAEPVVQGLEENACNQIPDADSDPAPYSYRPARFCDDPEAWVGYVVTAACEAFCDPQAVVDIVCSLIPIPEADLRCQV